MWLPTTTCGVPLMNDQARLRACMSTHSLSPHLQLLPVPPPRPDLRCPVCHIDVPHRNNASALLVLKPRPTPHTPHPSLAPPPQDPLAAQRVLARVGEDGSGPPIIVDGHSLRIARAEGSMRGWKVGEAPHL